MAVFFEDFTGPAGQWIKDRPGWAHLSGYYDALQTDGAGNLGIAARSNDGRSVVHDVGATSMYAEVVIGAGFLAGEGECFVNVASDASTDGLNFAYYQASGELRLRFAGSALYTYTGPLAVGDTLKLCYLYVGSLYELYRNGVLLTSGDISAYTPSPVTGVAISLSYSSSAARSDVLRSFKADVYSGPPDTTPPTLTSATATAGNTTATGTVTTNENNGTLYYVATINATETAVTVKAGLSQAVTATGVQNVSLSGLTNGTTYRIHYVHTDAALNDSTVLSSNTFTPHIPDSTPPTMNGSITVGTKTGTTLSISYPVGSDNVGVTGYEVSKDSGTSWLDNGNALSYTFLALSPLTSYPLRVRAYDAAGNRAATPLAASATTYRAGASAATVLATTGPQAGNPAGFLYAFASTVLTTDWLSYTITSPPTPAGGTLVADPDGSFSYVGPSPATMIIQPEVNGVNSSDTITVTLYDQAADSTPPTLTGSITLNSKTSTTINVSCPTGSDNVGVVGYDWSKDSGVTWVTSANTYSFTGLTPNTAYDIRVRARDAAGNTSTPALALSVTTDVAAAGPNLSAPTASSTGFRSISGTVTTDTANGTLYWLVNTSATATASAVKAGQSKAVTATGSQSVTTSGLNPGTVYYVHYLHTNAASVDSAVVDSASVTTGALSSATASATGTTTSSGSVSSTVGNGTLYWLTNTSPTATAAAVKAGQSKAVTATGVQTTTNTGLTASTVYYTHFVQTDVTGGDSAVLDSAQFTTQALAVGPSLTNPTATATGMTTSIGSVTTDTANGTLYWLTTTSASTTAATVKAAQSQAVTAVGVQNVSSTGLALGTVYYTHYVHTNGAGTDSLVSSSVSFTTSGDTQPPVLTGAITLDAKTHTTISVTSPVATDNVGVVSYEWSKDAGTTWIASTRSYVFTALTPTTVYQIRVRAKDAASNVSAPPLALSVTTDATPMATLPSFESLGYASDASSRSGVNTGSGRSPMRTPYGRISVFGKAGDVRYIKASDIVSVYTQGPNILAQSITGSVSIDGTLAPTDLALNPLQTGIWVNTTVVNPGSIVTLSFASVLRITFTQDATVYLMCV